MLKFFEELRRKAKAGDPEAAEKYNKIMECLNTMDDDRVANCIILMKEMIPELENQSALLIKKYVVDEERSLRYLSRDEINLIQFLRDNLKDGENRH